MKVYELFEAENIDDEFIEKKFSGGYWESCNKFIQDNWERDIESLSDKQGKWLTNILDDCVERKIEER